MSLMSSLLSEGGTAEFAVIRSQPSVDPIMRYEVRFLCEKFIASSVLTPIIGLPAPRIIVVGQDALAKYLVNLTYASEIFLKL